MAVCKSCEQVIEWGTTREKRFMPYDPEEVPVREAAAGIVAVRARDRLTVVLNEPAAMRVRTSGPRAWEGWSFHRSHWDTCPTREQHRVASAQEKLL